MFTYKNEGANKLITFKYIKKIGLHFVFFFFFNLEEIKT